MNLTNKENTSHQKVRKRKSTTSINSLFKESLLKEEIELNFKKVGSSYKCNPCDKLFKKDEDIKIHWNTCHRCILCEEAFPKNNQQLKGHLKEVHTSPEIKTFFKQLKNAENASHQNEVHNIPDSSEKQNGADSNITLANISNNESKPSSDKTLSEEMLEKEITQGLLNYVDSNKTKVLEVKTLKCSDEKSDDIEIVQDVSHQNEIHNIPNSPENVSQQNEVNNIPNSPKKQNENDSNIRLTNDLNTKLTVKDNCKAKAEKNDESSKSDDEIEETNEWSDFIKDLKKNKKTHKLFEGI